MIIFSKYHYCALVVLALTIGPINQGYAHPGHADPVTISRTTLVYLQKLVPHYLEVQKHLAASKLNDKIKSAAEAMQRLAEKASEKESDPSGKKMYKAVTKSASFIQAAGTIDAAREAFAELNDQLLPFFDNWPSHLIEQDLVLYICKETKQWWMQPNGEKIADPYRGADIHCGNLVEKTG